MPFGQGVPMPTNDEMLERAKKDLEIQGNKKNKKEKELRDMKEKYGEAPTVECAGCCNRKSDLYCSILNFPAYEWKKNKYCRCKNHVFKDIKGI